MLQDILDPKRANTWSNLNHLSFRACKDWIKTNFKEILSTLHKMPSEPVDPWNILGFACIDKNLYAEAVTIYDELLKITLFIIEIGNENLKNTIDNTVQMLDIAPTIIDYFGLPIPDSYQGKSLLPLIRGESVVSEKYIISETYQKKGLMKRNNDEGYKLLSIRNENWKYIYNEELDEELLFHIKIDPEEKRNLIKEEILKLKEFRRMREIHFQKISAVDELFKISRAINQIDLKKENF